MTQLTEQDILDINCLSSESIKYILSQPRRSEEATEMTGYLRGMRDVLFILGVSSQTKVYDDLIKATYYITDRDIGDIPTIL